MSKPKKLFKGAIVGFGFIAEQGHYPAYLKRNDVAILAIADISNERQAAALSKNNKLRVYQSAEELLQNEVDLDFIDIATPPYAHYDLVCIALERGLHVLCEKPLTTSLLQALSIMEKAQASRRVVFPCHNYKHSPVVKTVDAIIDSGEIGRVHGLTLNTYRTTHARGVTEWKTHWRRVLKYSGGGIGMDHGSHTFYLTFNWMKSFPTAVTAKAIKLSNEWDTEDNLSCTLTFPSGYATAHLTWTAGVRKVIYSVQGSKGGVTIDDDDIQVGTIEGKSRRVSVASHWGDASHVGWFNSMFDRFQKYIESSDYMNQDLLEAYHCIQIIEKAYESSKQYSQELKLTPFAI